jgi:hypothetical protein
MAGYSIGPNTVGWEAWFWLWILSSWSFYWWIGLEPSPWHITSWIFIKNYLKYSILVGKIDKYFCHPIFFLARPTILSKLATRRTLSCPSGHSFYSGPNGHVPCPFVWYAFLIMLTYVKNYSKFFIFFFFINSWFLKNNN